MLVHLCVAWQPLSTPLAPAGPRHSRVVAREVTFTADLDVTSEPFTVGSKTVGDFFAQPEGLQVLMSQAESSRRLDTAGDGAVKQRWEVATPIQFPGMVARSETSMDVVVDTAASRLTVTSGESKTVCEGGPSWARALLSRIGEIAETSSWNEITVIDASNGEKCVKSVVNLTVKLTIPGLLLPPFIPVGPFEKSGSESIQKLLDKDMAPTMAKFRDAYCSWSAS